MSREGGIASTWGEEAALRVLREGGSVLEALRAGLPWASELMARPSLRGLNHQEREDVVQAAWLEGIDGWSEEDEALEMSLECFLAYCVDTGAQQMRSAARTERRRGVRWEDERPKGENGWP